MLYNEKLKEARETGKGIATKFQEKANYTIAIGGGFDCPFCSAYHGYKLDDNKEIISTFPSKVMSMPYELPTDIEWMCQNGGYSWHEDCKCSNCNHIYTQNNGC